MVSPQMFAYVAAFLVIAASCCLIRLFFLNLQKTYPAFVFFLLAQIASSVLSSVANVRTAAYAYIYLALLVLEWLAYGLMIRELHSGIFSHYPGIAILGRWCIYFALAATSVVVALGFGSAGKQTAQLGTLLVAWEFASHCLLLGFAGFILLILLVISKYPLELPKNVLVNSLFFSVVLLGEAANLLIEQFSSRRYTAGVNLTLGFLGGLSFVVWGFFLSREGQISVPSYPTRQRPEEEARLLHHLSTVNSLLLRFARKIN